MALQGNLQDLKVADLIQLICQDQKNVALYLTHSGQQTVIYFKDGKVLHAVSGNQTGEALIFQALAWEEGQFRTENFSEPPAITITRSWMDLLLEGAKRLDENGSEFSLSESGFLSSMEEKSMEQKLEDILKEMSTEVNGYTASMIVGTDGIHVAFHSRTKLDPELAGAQMTLLLKLVETSAAKTGAGEVVDNLLTTENSYLMMKHLADKQYFLGVVADRKTANIGNLRLIVKMYTGRISNVMAH
jgi:predicted regulator of Ras-like GTPase activity (Roadblock/LC7/MglB family)